MAIRIIRTDDDPILRKKAKEVGNINDRLKVLIDDMFETMDASYGVGLAAPQVGILKRVITIDDNAEENNTRMYMINPVITRKDGSDVCREGCLSIPGKQGDVERATDIDVSYENLNGEKLEMNAKDFLARIIQHEIDHLDGILYTDRALQMYRIIDQDEDLGEEEEIWDLFLWVPRNFPFPLWKN